MTIGSPTLPYSASQRHKAAPSGVVQNGHSGAFIDGNSRRLTSSQSHQRSALFERSRVTNLAVLLLAGIAAVSLLLNIRLWLNRFDVFSKPGSTHFGRLPVDIKQTLHHPYADLKHMVMVPGHAIWMGCDPAKAGDDADWILEPFQKGGDVRTYMKHIRKAAEIAVNDPEALLIYSGGQTRPGIELTEATSYARLAKLADVYAKSPANGLSSAKAARFDRVTTEEFALDSFENLLFSLARFKEFTGRYPTFITIVGYDFKRKRYEEVHRAAVRWPLSAFRYEGIGNDHDSNLDYEGEEKGGLAPFRKDLYGCSGVLLAKRKRRNIYRRFHPYHSSAPELSQLLQHCPRGTALFRGRLPWD